MADDADAPDGEVTELDVGSTAGEPPEAAPARGPTRLRLAAAVGVLVVVTVGGLAGWFGFRAYQAHQDQQRQAMLVQVGRQGALNLTTIDYTRVDADIQRILDSATGTFYSDFEQRSTAFAEVVKQAQSKSAGTITEAGLESVTGDSGQVLVTVSVQTSNAGAAEQQPRLWRMRIGLQQVGDDIKVSDVGFVP